MQRVSDLVCLEHGLSVIEKRKPSERQKRTTYPKRKAYRSDICEIIDGIIAEGPKDCEEFLKRLQEEGFEIKRGKHTAIREKEQKRFIRLSAALICADKSENLADVSSALFARVS